MTIFRNRIEAGKLLGERLKEKKDVCILALPRGGVPVAYEVAKKLKVAWSILLVKKISVPEHPELAVGAVSEDGKPVWDLETISFFGLKKKYLRKLANETKAIIQTQLDKWGQGASKIDIHSKTVVLVDDGLATGLTMKAAIEIVKRRGASRVIVAVPVASKPAVTFLSGIAEEVISLETPEPFFSVGQWYDDFTQVNNETVVNLLADKVDEESSELIKIPVENFYLPGLLVIPKNAKGVVIFAHGSGSTYRSPRNRMVATSLNKIGFATLLFDLLNSSEAEDKSNIFNIALLGRRLFTATNWIRSQENIKELPVGYFGASTGAAAALMAASKDKTIVSVVSRGGRPDLAMDDLEKVKCPVLLLVGGEDYGVIELNEKAKTKLKQSELIIIPGAGHLFEEPGTLDDVVEYVCDWFQNTLNPLKDVKVIMHPHEQVVNDIKKLAKPIESRQHLKPLIEKLAQSRVVMLGEATHGTEEFYETRKIISQDLIENYGFKFIAVEGDWPDCYQLNKYIQSDKSKEILQVMQNFARWPTWMWANNQVADLVKWMKTRGVAFYGLDVYSLYESLDCVKSYSKKLNPQFAAQLLEAYSCLDLFGRDEIAYAKSLIKWPDGCEKEIMENLRKLLRLRLDQASLDEEELFDIQQNAKIINNASKYYHSMMFGGPESWNIRDEHMMDTLDVLLRYHGEGAKGIVWAHNTHVGDYHATDMVNEGYVNLGGLARERYGIENVSLVGFGTYQGEVLAGKAWGAKPEIMQIAPASRGSYEDYFHRASQESNLSRFYVLLEDTDSLKIRRGHRAIGVVYQSVFEIHGSNYVPTEIANRYDAFVFIDKTTALKALPSNLEKGVLPETWPVGV